MQSDSVGTTIPIMFVIFGLIWVLGVIGSIRLYGIVKYSEYFVLCLMSICGGAVLLGIIHFCGNIPKGCRELVTDLKFNYETMITTSSWERKLLRRYVRSLRLFGIRSEPIRLIKHNAIYLYFGALINCVVTFLVANSEQQ
jgi:hypothetical protein